ncbi:MAG TPA: hypothetical protein HPQ04_04540, partial [Rhodospirillaceae bacterium]|nr:hypothetical protein [Rhodospirillaceae bacterium]
MTLSFFDELVCETAMELARFRSVPLVLRGVTTGVDRDLYLDVLAGTYHTQRQTNRLTEQAISRCGEADSLLESWLRAILVAEKNQEDRILDDIRVLGGDPNRVQRSQPPRAVVAMATYAGDAIEQSSPYVLLGMRHVLNCVSLILARTAENTMRARLEADHAATGFAYFL